MLKISSLQAGSAKLLPASFKSLNSVAAILKEDADLELEIEGHADKTGKAEKNQLLSEQRAKAVLDYLSNRTGINASRLTATCFGDTRPVAGNKTARGNALNRSVILTPEYF